MQFGIIGSGSWATAIAKILTDNGNDIHWWIRNEEMLGLMQKRKHNPQYLSSVYFNQQQLFLSNDLTEVVAKSDILVIAVPSAYAESVLESLPSDAFKGKKIVSAIKGILPNINVLLNDYLSNKFQFPIIDYFTVLGPCHAEEVAGEKLSYLTFSGIQEATVFDIARYFETEYINTVVNQDVIGVQYAAVLKNIYALGAGIAHGLDYGDNFLSVYIANSANEMSQFFKALPINSNPSNKEINYTASVYLGDLLVTCYSLYSRNRTFGNMIGKGYSVKAAQLEMSMVAEGYNAARCMYNINQTINADMPIAETVYKILWQNESAESAMKAIEEWLI
jgi:glycerol-3-phosphate dehydrogenase (NAD(P)+)